MIIKSMSRKEASFSQLLAYMEKGSSGERAPIFQNLHSGSIEDLIHDFEDNATLLQKRKGGVFLYHEILSFKNNDTLSFEEKAEKLKEIASEYLTRRSEHSLAYGVIHEDKTHHTHVHLCISSNGLGDSKRVRQSKADFQKMKVDFEKHVLENYPELGQTVSIDKVKETRHTSKGGELKRRTGKLNKKEETIARFQDIFRSSASKEAFFERMGAEKLEVYARGNTIGFLDSVTGRKYRLKTLGLDSEFQLLSNRLDLSGKGPVIDYSKAKGQSERVSTARDTTEPKDQQKAQDSKVKNPFTRKKPAPESENKKPPAPDSADGGSTPAEGKKFGRFGTIKEWVTGDFKDRTEHQKEQSRLDEEVKRQARYDARYEAKQEAKREAERMQREAKAQEPSKPSPEAEARKQRFQEARSSKERGKSKDGPDR